MDIKLDKKLCNDFPELYADRFANMQTTCMNWGFEHGDGWFQIIYDLSKRLTELIRALPEKEQSRFRASQVKEKFGGLRYYMTISTDEMEKLINEAELKSETTCEQCGKSGTLRGKGWYYTACDKCEAKKQS